MRSSNFPRLKYADAVKTRAIKPIIPAGNQEAIHPWSLKILAFSAQDLFGVARDQAHCQSGDKKEQ